jgi:hypothetical protein
VTALTPTGDPTALPDPELSALLEQLEREERIVSRRRNTLHDRIDFLRSGGFASASPDNDDLALLLDTERELSARRHVLHRQIDELRAERSRRRPMR